MTSRRRFGAVRKLPSGRWQARYLDHLGRRHTAPATFAKKSQADRWLASVETDLVRNDWWDPQQGQVLFSEWVGHYLATASHLRAATLVQKRRVLERRWLPPLGGLALGAISTTDVQTLVAEMAESLAPQTVRTEYAVLASVVNAALDAGLLAKSPLPRRPNLPKVPRSTKARIGLEELERLAAAIDARYAVLVWTVGLTGLRWSEVAGLRVRSLDFLARPPVVHVVETSTGKATKTDASDRSVPMPSQLVDRLAAHLADEPRAADDLVFTAPRGAPLRYNDFYLRQWRPATKAAGMDGLTIHALRHSAAGLWRAQGIHTQVIAKWLGHADDRVTSQIYGWVPDELDRAGVRAVEAALSETFGHAGGTPAVPTAGA